MMMMKAIHTMKISTQVASMSLLAKLHWLTSQLAQVVANTIIEFLIIIINIIASTLHTFGAQLEGKTTLGVKFHINHNHYDQLLIIIIYIKSK